MTNPIKEWDNYDNKKIYVKDLETRKDLILITDSQEIKSTLESVGLLKYMDYCGCLFVEVGEGDYEDIYLCEYSVPLIWHRVYNIY